MEEYEGGRKEGNKYSKKRWREVTAVAVSNSADENQTSSISPSHSLTLHSVSFCISLSLRPKIMRSLPSQGPFQIKMLCVSPLSLSIMLCLSLSTSRLPRDRPAPHCTHIRTCTVSNPRAHKKKFLSDPICLTVTKNSTALICRCTVCTDCAQLMLCTGYILGMFKPSCHCGA